MRLENINLDCVDSAAAGTFWAEVLGAEIITREPTLWEARLRVGEFWMDLCFETVPEPGPDPREHRLHLDLAGGPDHAASVERLIAPDLEGGVFDQLAVRGHPLPIVAAAKIAGHWIAFAPPVIGAALLSAAFYVVPADQVQLMFALQALLGLVLHTPAIMAGEDWSAVRCM